MSEQPDKDRSLQERIAHLIRAVDDLSDIVTRQTREIEMLTRRVGLLMEREAQREQDNQTAGAVADSRPPHW